MFKKLRKFKENRKIILIVSIIFVLFILFAGSDLVLAQGNTTTQANINKPSDIMIAIVTVLGWISFFLSYVVGFVATIFIDVLIWVAQFNNIIGVDAVRQGWVIVRDLCNMFFILILLVIAFATILRIESYSAKRLLPKLLIMAVLINFSKTIFGLIIDFSQVIMLTFVNGFATTGTGHFVNMFQMNKYLSMDEVSKQAYGSGSALAVAAGILMGLFAMIISAIVILVLLVVLVFRIIMLWVYTILSPLVFFGAAFPGGQKYTSRIWEDFIKQVIVGPLLAFFIWLALLTAGTSSSQLSQQQLKVLKSGGQVNVGGQQVVTSPNSLFSTINFQSYAITIALLIGGLMVTQSIGGVAGSAAGKGMQWAKRAGAVPLAGAKTGLLWGGRKLDTLQMKAQRGVAGLLGKEYTPKTLNYKMIAQGFKAKKATDMSKYESLAGPHGSLVWQDTFNRHLRLKQYMGIAKPQKIKIRDEEKAKRLDFGKEKLQQRFKDSQESSLVARMERETYFKDNESLIKKDYKDRGFDAEKEFAKDLKAVTEPQSFNTTETSNKIDQITNEAVKLRRGHWGPEWATREPMIYSKSGAKEQIDKEESAMKRRTDEKDFAVVSELVDATNNKDINKVVSALRILFSNNDMNEALRDKRMMSLMTKEGGLLERLAKSGEVEGLNTETLQTVKRDFESNPVTPAMAQTMVQGLFQQTGLDKRLAARYAGELGTISFKAGNSLGYAMSFGNAVTGENDFSKMRFENGKLQTSDERKAATAGKFSNMESQTKMKALHPNIFITEDINGKAAGIHEDAKEFLKSLSAHDLTQINRMRADTIRKIGSSFKTLREIKNFTEQLALSEDKKDRDQAEIIKRFAGYVKGKYEGKDLDEMAALRGSLDSYNEI